MKRTLVFSLTTLALLIGTSAAQATFKDFGYFNVFDVKRLQDESLVVTQYGNHMRNFHNIQGTVAEIPTYLGCEKGHDWLGPADVAPTIAGYAANNGFDLILSLQWVLFEKAGKHCGNGGDRLRMDWESRLETYANHAGGLYNSSNVAYMIIHTEVNNSPQISQAEMVQVTLRAKELFPGIKATAGYPTSAGAQALPPLFPWPLDIIFTWTYDITNPNDPTYLAGRYADFLSRLQIGQTVGVVIEGFRPMNNPNDDPFRGISNEFLRTLARRWCSFAKVQPLVEHVIGFHWGTVGNDGTDDIIHLELATGGTSLEQAHRAVANAASTQGNGSCWATGG